MMEKKREKKESEMEIQTERHRGRESASYRASQVTGEKEKPDE